MKQGRSLTELAAEVERQANAKKDFVVRSRVTMMADDARLFVPVPGLEPMPMQDTAKVQLAEYLDIPRDYYRRLDAQFPALLAKNVNTLMLSRPQTEKRLVRTLDGKARAWLSNSYRPIDNVGLMTQLMPVLLDRQDLSFASAEITERKLYIKVISSELECEVKRGDVVRMGLLIQNSEIGLGSVVIAPFTDRLICTNGAVHTNMGQRRSHVGRALGNGDNSDAAEFFSDETRKADDNAFFLNVRDVIKATLSGDMLSRLLDGMREAVGEKIEGDPNDAVDAVAVKVGLNEEEKTGVLRHLIEGADLSRWGLANAITRVAQDATTYDRATELESVGGDLMLSPISTSASVPVRVRRRTREVATVN